MTGIPDEVVERVAMAIDEKQHHPMTDYDWSAGVALVKAGESGNPYKLARIRVAMEQARAALSASRWMEMKEALAALVADGSGCFGGSVEWQCRVDTAKHILKNSGADAMLAARKREGGQ